MNATYLLDKIAAPFGHCRLDDIVKSKEALGRPKDLAVKERFFTNITVNSLDKRSLIRIVINI